MGNWFLLKHDPDTQTVVAGQLQEDGRMLVRTVQNVDKILEANAEAEKATMGVRFPDWTRVASVPLRMIEKTNLDVAVSMGDKKYVSKILNDSDFNKVRTSRGKV